MRESFIYLLAMLNIEENMKQLKEIELVKMGFDEADDIIMCVSCEDAVASQIIGRGLGEQEVCTDCYYEIGDRGY